MNKAIIDTCFLEKFNTKNGFQADDFITLISGAGFELVIHPYVYENEMKMLPYVDTVIRKEVCRVADYSSFLKNDYEKFYYSGLYIEIYNDFCERQKIINPKKAEYMHKLGNNVDVFTCRYSKSSMGDVHVILLSLFLDVPIIMSEDNSDMNEIYQIAKSKMNSDKHVIEVLRVCDVVDIAKQKGTIDNKELKRIKRAFG